MKAKFLVLLGLILAVPSFAQQPSQGDMPAEEPSLERERAIERCNEHRGTDCETDAGLAEWLLQERSRGDAEAEGSRSKHQTAPRPTPRPAN